MLASLLRIILLTATLKILERGLDKGPIIFDYYKSERLFTKNQIFDYKINRINGPINDTSKTDNHYYDVSYSVKTIAPAWIAGNGKNEGLWVNSKSEFYNLIKNNDQYILNRVGGL